MSLINDFIDGEYGSVIYNGKTIVIIELDDIRYLQTLNLSLYRILKNNTNNYDTLILVISKTLMDYSVLIKHELGKKNYLYNYGNTERITFDELFYRFPEIKKKVNMNEIGLPRVKDLIYRYCNNDPYVTSNMILQWEPLISEIKEHKNNKGKSYVLLKFDNNEDYWNLFDYKDYDINFMSNLFSSYGSAPVDSSDYSYNDWREGYFMYNFDSENLKKIKEILSYINPGLNEKLKLDNNGRIDFDEKNASQILDFLGDNFSRECEDIQYKWVELNDEAFIKEYEEIIEEENSNFFEQYDIFKQSSFYKYYTTMNKILELYNKVPNSDYMSLYEVLSKLGEDLDKTDDFNEQIYGYGIHAQNFDSTQFNEYTKSKLDDIIEKIQDDWQFTDQTEYFKILNDLQKKGFIFNQVINHPTKKGRQFIILGVDPETNKIRLNMRLDGNQPMKGQEWTLEEFNNYLYHPELFESKKIGKRKI